MLRAPDISNRTVGKQTIERAHIMHTVSPSVDKELTWPREPYKGLAHLGPDERLLFWGRGNEVERCKYFLAQAQTRVLVLHGQTGCGKSSFLRAGLIPSLEQTAFAYMFLRRYSDANDTEGSPVFIRSGADPIGRLAEAIYTAGEGPQWIKVCEGIEPRDVSEARLDRASIQDFVEYCRKPGVLVMALQKLSETTGVTLVLVIDQAEEVITLASGGNERRRLFFSFLKDFTTTEFPVKLVLAIRKDYSGEFIELAQMGSGITLAREVEPANVNSTTERRQTATLQPNIRLFLLSEMGKADVLNAMLLPTRKTSPVPDATAPRQVYKFCYRPNVAEEICNDLYRATTSGAVLPVMQIVCRDLYEKVKKGECGPDGLWEIDSLLYTNGGRISGPVDRHISKALTEALVKGDADPSKLGDLETRGRDFLYMLVRRESDNSVHTDQFSLAKIREVAREIGLAVNVDGFVEYLSRDDILLLKEFSIPSASSVDERRMFSLGHDVIGVVLEGWLQRRKVERKAKRAQRKAREAARQAEARARQAASEAEEKAQQATRETEQERRRAAAKLRNALIALGALMVFAVLVQLANQEGKISTAYDVLVTTASNRLHQAPVVALDVATQATALATALHWLTFWKSRDLRADQLLAHIAYGLPDKVVSLGAATALNGGKWLFPLAQSAGFASIVNQEIIVKRPNKDGVYNEHVCTLPPDYPIGRDPLENMTVSESETGTVLLLDSSGTFSGERGLQWMYSVFICKSADVAFGPYHDSYFKAKLSGSEFAGPTQGSRGVESKEQEERPLVNMTLSNDVLVMRIYSDSEHVRTYSFVLDESRPQIDPFKTALTLGENVLTPGEDRSLQPAEDQILGSYLIRFQQVVDSSKTTSSSLPKAPWLIARYDLRSASNKEESIPLDRALALASCTDGKVGVEKCVLHVVPQTEGSTLVVLGVSHSDKSPRSSAFGTYTRVVGQPNWTGPNWSSYESVVLLDPKSQGLMAIKITDVRDACLQKGDNSFGGTFGDRLEKGGAFSVGTLDSLIVGTVLQQSAELVQVQNAAGKGVVRCIGRIYFPGQSTEWAVSNSGGDLLATDSQSGQRWNAPIELAKRIAGAPKASDELIRVACTKGLAGHELAPDAWADLTGLVFIPRRLCAN
jgi:hypothetical protein